MTLSIRAVFIILAALAVALLTGGLVWWFQGNKLVDIQRERNNLLAERDTLRQVAGGWERAAMTAASEKELLEGVNEELQDHLDDTDRRLRSITSAVLELRDSQGIETHAVSRGDSTTIPWSYQDESVTLRLALAFPGMIRPDPTPPVTGTLDLGVTIRPQIAISCDPDTGAPYANIEAGDERVTVQDLVTTVDEEVACLAAKRPSLGSLIPQPTIGTGIAVGAGAAICYFLCPRR